MRRLVTAYRTWQDRHFMDDRRAVAHPVSPYSRHFFLALVVLVVTLLVWSNFAMLDEVTRGDGKVVLSKDTQIIQNLEGGIVSEILIESGSVVNPGDVLLRIDDTRFSSNFMESAVEHLTLKAETARLEAEATGSKMVIPEGLAGDALQIMQNEENLFAVRRNELDSSLEVIEQQRNQIKQQRFELISSEQRLRESLKLAKKELAITEPMLAGGAVSEIEVLRLRREVNELEGQVEAAGMAINKVNAALEENRNKSQETENRFKTEAQRELNEKRSKVSMLEKSLPALEDRVARTTVRSPVRGVVKRLMVKTVGGVVQPGSDLVEIVPLGDRLQIEARIRPSDIAFLYPKQRAMVKFTAYDFGIYGGLEGELEQISADTIFDEKSEESYYRVLLRTAKSELIHNGESLPIIPGMVVNVEVMTGQKSVLDYLLKPLLKTRQRAMTER